MSKQSLNICPVCCELTKPLVNFDIRLCYACAAKTEKQMSDDEFFDKHPQPKILERSICINHYTQCDLKPSVMQRCTAIDNCKDDSIILKKNDDLYIYQNVDSHEIRSSITFKPVSNYRYNEPMRRIEKIDPTIEEEDRRLIILRKNPKAILFEDYEKKREIEFYKIIHPEKAELDDWSIHQLIQREYACFLATIS
jgi:hypothetical protein